MILTLKGGLLQISFNQQLKDTIVFKLRYGGMQVLLLIINQIYRLERMVLLK